MVDDFIHDPVLAVRCIFGFELPPHQQIRLWSAWTHTYSFDSSGFGTGKTFTIALLAALRMMLFEDCIEGIIGKTYVGGKQIFNYFDKWCLECPIFRNQIRVNRQGEPAIVHGADACTVTMRNGNQGRVIPPDFQKDSERVASESWTNGYFDEWVRYRNYIAFNKVIIGRVRAPIHAPHTKRDPIFGNHIFFSGTAQCKWHPAYARIQHALEQISLGSKGYDVISFNHTHIPEKYEWLNSTDIAREAMMASLRQDEIQSEIMGIWVDDSIGYYNAKNLAACRLLDPMEIVA